MMSQHIPSQVTLHREQRLLEVAFEAQSYQLPCEYLRVYSPSAEVRGHAPGEEKLQIGKEEVNIEKIEQVGTYALKFTYDDGHDSGIYDWEMLYDLAVNHEANWQDYLNRLAAAGIKRKVN
ncbi:MAG: DUF971 domain-containing protein [Gammaproteobacteria bacterium]|nr:DUF971 domain-containing protein [Gammaproteobacteria bacterium]